MATAEPGRVPCALVVQGNERGDRPELVVVIFDGAQDAAEFAARHRIDEWTVAPVAFGVEMDRTLRA